MTRTLNTTFAAALLAASVFGGSAALAGDNYYKGASPFPENEQQSQQVDRFTTQSIHNGNGAVKAAPASTEVGAAHGDYYPGVAKQQ